MVRNLLCLLLLIFFSAELFCQGFAAARNLVEESFTVDIRDENLDLELITQVRNESETDTLFLKWQRIIVNQPLDWQTQVCDNNLCYDPMVSTNVDSLLDAPVFLPPQASFDLIFHVLPNNMVGVGEFQLLFSLVDEPDQIIDTIRFVASVADETTSFDLEKSKLSLKVFPNPAFEYFELSDNYLVDEIVVHTILGTQVKTFYTKYNAQSQYDISDLNNGLYLLSLINYDTGVLKTLRLSKRDFRP